MCVVVWKGQLLCSILSCSDWLRSAANRTIRHSRLSDGRWITVTRQQQYGECVRAAECVTPVQSLPVSLSPKSSNTVSSAVCISTVWANEPVYVRTAGSATASITKSLNLQFCQGVQTWDCEMAKTHSLFPYIFIKVIFSQPTGFLRSVSRVVDCFATPEGCGREEVQCKPLSRRSPLGRWWATHSSQAAPTWARHQSSVPHPSRASVRDGLTHSDSSVD